MAVEKVLRIILDHREVKLREIFNAKKEKIVYELKQLDIADVVVSQNVAIERKEGLDFVASIMDNRLFEQLLRLKEAYPNPILILEGLNDEVFQSTGMNIASIYGALSYASYKMGIAVIPTRNIEDTAIVIERIAYREQVKDNAPVISRKAPKTKTMEEQRAFIVEGLEDCGPKKSKILIEKFKTPYYVFEAIRTTEILYTKTGNPKGVKGPIEELDGFGWKFVQKNKELLFGIREKERQKKINEI